MVCRPLNIALRLVVPSIIALQVLSATALQPIQLWAAPQDPENYVLLQGGLLDIADGSYIEGSWRQGGIQPDYIIDWESREFQKIRNFARRLKKRTDLSYWEKIDSINRYLSERVFPNFSYDAPDYLRLNKRHLKMKQDVPLSKYVACGSGVCREYALVVHLALKEAGIQNQHVYAKIHRASKSDGLGVVEDHAFVVVKHQGKRWVVDPYYWGFNGFLLDDLLRPEGVTASSRAAPIATPGPDFRSILEINPFPRIWRPKKCGLRESLTELLRPR